MIFIISIRWGIFHILFIFSHTIPFQFLVIVLVVIVKRFIHGTLEMEGNLIPRFEIVFYLVKDVCAHCYCARNSYPNVTVHHVINQARALKKWDAMGSPAIYSLGSWRPSFFFPYINYFHDFSHFNKKNRKKIHPPEVTLKYFVLFALV